MERYIQQLAALLADHFIDVDTDPQLFIQNNQLIQAHASHIGSYRKYLGLLHDSEVLTTTEGDNEFSIKVNDFTTHVFADAVVERFKLNINHDTLVFPLVLNFESPEITFNTVDQTGKLQEINPVEFHEYLYEQIIAVDDSSITIGLVVWRHFKSKPGQHILILIKAARINLIELQSVAWHSIFDQEFDNCYEYFKEQFARGRYLSDYVESSKLLDEYFNK